MEEFFVIPEAAALLRGYADESALPGMPEAKSDIGLYRQLEAAGVYHVFGAFREDFRLVGFAGLIVSRNPHYSVLIGTIESIYVDPKSRAGGMGLELIRACKTKASEVGAVGLFSAAPANGKLDQIYERMDCTLTNRVYFWGLA